MKLLNTILYNYEIKKIEKLANTKDSIEIMDLFSVAFPEECICRNSARAYHIYESAERCFNLAKLISETNKLIK